MWFDADEMERLHGGRPGKTISKSQGKSSPSHQPRDEDDGVDWIGPTIDGVFHFVINLVSH